MPRQRYSKLSDCRHECRRLMCEIQAVQAQNDVLRAKVLKLEAALAAALREATP